LKIASDVLCEYRNDYSIQDKEWLWATGSTCAVLVANGMVTLSLEVFDQGSNLAQLGEILTKLK
jgi:hypothetical protein